ncbi:NAD(P)/FAD-dependent oxidoreductase [Paenibacillus chartarius]|uniref:NAD(P)/FAD-dependent oxidoreductase n=1 Tax=Paenibacillus chartarius TaxID=747481 RepID=A0ABV6DTK5_9BACL
MISGQPERYDVVIAGAGIGGTALAGALASRGWRVIAIDRDDFPRHKVCGEFLSPEAGRMLAKLGVDLPPDSETAPRRLTAARLHAEGGGGPLVVPLPGTALGWSRHALDTALHEAARRAGAIVQTAATVTAVEPEDGGDGWLVRIRSGEQLNVIRARIAVAAWGRHARSGLPGSPSGRGRRPGAASAFVGVKLHMETARRVAAAVDMFFSRDGYIGVAPVEGNRLNVAALMSRDAFRSSGGTVQSAVAHYASRHRMLAELLDGGAVVAETVTAVSPVAAALLPAAKGALPPVGDAAALVPPLCGDGMAMALRSALLCAELADACLAGRMPAAEWERRYREALRRELAAPIRWGRLLHAGLRQPRLARALLELGRLVPALPQSLIRATRLRG